VLDTLLSPGPRIATPHIT